MIFHETELGGAFLIELEPHRDARGSFARTWCAREFAEMGIDMTVAQANTAVTRKPGTLRGLHYQLPPHGEAKLIRVVRGGIYDVIVDLRPDSATYGAWAGFELSADEPRLLYVPERFAHGYLTLEPDTEVSYQVSHPYSPGAERGIRYDDPRLGIRWPRTPAVLSDKDRSWPPLSLTDPPTAAAVRAGEGAG